MTLTLTHLTDLQRVRVTLSDLSDGSVLVERSATPGFQIPVTVRGGVALPVSAGVGQVDDYEFFADVTNHFRVVPIDPPAGLLLPGVAGDYASTPDTGVLDITGDLDVRADATLADWTPAAAQSFLGKYESTGDQRGFRFDLLTTGNLRLRWSANGTNLTTADSTAVVPATSGRLAVRATLDVDDGAGNKSVVFYTAATMAGPWTQLGDPVTTAGTTSIFPNTAPLEAGSHDGGDQQNLAGNLHAIEVRSGIDGTLVANPDFAAQAGGATDFSDAAGRTWTVQGDAQVVGIETASITPSLAGKVWLKSIRYPSQNRPLFRVIDRGSSIVRPARGGLANVAGRGTPTAQFDARGSRQFVLPIQVADQSAADAMDLILAAGKEFFIHVPPSLTGKVPGGYVWIGDLDEQRRTTSDRWVFDLPCVEIAPPGPDLVGTTLTVGQLVAAQGSIDAVWAAFPTIRDMWDSLGSLDALVVV